MKQRSIGINVCMVAIALFFMMSFLPAQNNGVQVIGIGKAALKEVAFQRACIDGILKYLEKNLKEDIFKNNENKLIQAIGQGYKECYQKLPTLLSWDGNTAKISGVLNKKIWTT